MSFKKYFFLVLYYTIFRYFPASTIPILGSVSKKIRYICCKNIFKECGRNVNVEFMAQFSTGFNLCIGNNSGLGINSKVPNDIVIGNDVMMGPNCTIFSRNHCYARIDIPMNLQGAGPPKKTFIGDDVWIGENVILTPGRIIKRGTVIGAGCVLSKNYPEFTVIGGNPCKILKKRF